MSHRFGNSAKRFCCNSDKRGENPAVIIDTTARCVRLQLTENRSILEKEKAAIRCLNICKQRKKPLYAENRSTAERGISYIEHVACNGRCVFSAIVRSKGSCWSIAMCKHKTGRSMTCQSCVLYVFRFGAHPASQ